MTPPMTPWDQPDESAMRRLAHRHGLALRKDRARRPNIDHHGGYMLVDVYTNFIIGGERFDWSLADVAAHLDELSRSHSAGPLPGYLHGVELEAGAR